MTTKELIGKIESELNWKETMSITAINHFMERTGISKQSDLYIFAIVPYVNSTKAFIGVFSNLLENLKQVSDNGDIELDAKYIADLFIEFDNWTNMMTRRYHFAMDTYYGIPYQDNRMRENIYYDMAINTEILDTYFELSTIHNLKQIQSNENDRALQEILDKMNAELDTNFVLNCEK